MGNSEIFISGGETSNTDAEPGFQDILQFGLHRGKMNWRSIGNTKFKAKGAGVSPIAYRTIQGKGQDNCPTFINEARRSAASGTLLTFNSV